MLKKLFNLAVDTYKKSKMTLIDIDNEQTKLDILNLLALAVVVDNEINESELKQFAKFIKEILYADNDIETIIQMIKSLFADFNTQTNSTVYIDSFKEGCLILSEKLNNKQKDELLHILLKLIQADGEIDSGERELLKLYRENIKYNGIFGKSKKISDLCPGCRGGNVSTIRTVELDRWIKPKKVTEKLASGKTKTRYVNTTYIEEKKYYKCGDCAQEFSQTYTREK